MMNNDYEGFDLNVVEFLKSEKAKGLRIMLVGLLLAIAGVPFVFFLEPVAQFLVAIGVIVGFVGFGVQIVYLFTRH